MPRTAATTRTRTRPSARDTAVMAPIARRGPGGRARAPGRRPSASPTPPLTRASAAGGSSRSAPSPRAVLADRRGCPARRRPRPGRWRPGPTPGRGRRPSTTRSAQRRRRRGSMRTSVGWVAGSTSSPVSTVGWVATTGIGPSAVSSASTGSEHLVAGDRGVRARRRRRSRMPDAGQAHHVAVDPVGQLVLDEPGLAQPGQQRRLGRRAPRPAPAADTSAAP